MIQNQLIDYIVAQKKSGVSRDSIVAALTGVGWQAADVEETMKKVEADASPATSSTVSSAAIRSEFAKSAATPASSQASPSSSPAKFGGGVGGFSPVDAIGGVVAPKTGASPQPIKTSDFLSGVRPAASVSSARPMSSAISSAKPAMMSGSGMSGGSSSKGKIVMIVEIIVIVALAGLSGVLYMQNSGLNDKVTTLTNSSSGSAAQASGLQGQIQTLTASQTALQTQVADLTAANADLKGQLAFFASPLGTSSLATGSISGIVTFSGTGKGVYSMRTAYDAVIFVKNSADAKVAAMLKPLVGATTTLTGSYLPGSDALTVISVNGNPVNPPATSTTPGAVVMPPATPATGTASTTTP